MSGKLDYKGLVLHSLVFETISFLYLQVCEDFCITSDDLLFFTIFKKLKVFAVSLGRHSRLDDWKSILSNSKAKTKLTEPSFDKFKKLLHVLHAALSVGLSRGFQDLMKKVIFSRSGSINTDFVLIQRTAFELYPERGGY